MSTQEIAHWLVIQVWLIIRGLGNEDYRGHVITTAFCCAVLKTFNVQLRIHSGFFVINVAFRCVKTAS